jgi:acyl carrier protein
MATNNRTDSLLAECREILADFFDLDPAAVVLSADLRDDLGLDSLDLMEMLMELEDRYAFDVEREDLAEIRTVSDAIALAERLIDEGAVSRD